MSKIKDADKIVVANIEAPGQGISPASIEQNDQQCIRHKIGKRKRIYSLTAQVCDNFSTPFYLKNSVLRAPTSQICDSHFHLNYFLG